MYFIYTFFSYFKSFASFSVQNSVGYRQVVLDIYIVNSE